MNQMHLQYTLSGKEEIDRRNAEEFRYDSGIWYLGTMHAPRCKDAIKTEYRHPRRRS